MGGFWRGWDWGAFGVGEEGFLGEEIVEGLVRLDGHVDGYFEWEVFVAIGEKLFACRWLGGWSGVFGGFGFAEFGEGFWGDFGFFGGIWGDLEVGVGGVRGL